MAAACIGCGACVAVCKNASAMLFVAAKVGHFKHLPEGRPEADSRALVMVRAMDSRVSKTALINLSAKRCVPRRSTRNTSAD